MREVEQLEQLRDSGGRWLIAGGGGEMHNLIHRGLLYFVSRRVRTSASAMDIHVKTGARQVHFETLAKVGLAAPLDVIEGVTISNDGTAMVGRNFNRNFPDNGGLVRVFHTPAYTGGTVIKENQAGFGSSPGTGTAGETDGRREYVLKPNTSYVFKIAPTGSTDTIFIGEYYEGA